MLRTFIRFADGRISLNPDDLPQALDDKDSTLWLDMNQPTDEELGLLDDVFGFHPLAIEDSIQYSQRPKIESYNHIGDRHRQGYFYMVFHGPDLESFQQNLRTREVDIFVSQQYLVSIHDEPMKSIDELALRAQGDTRMVLDRGIDVLLHNILDHIVDAYQPILEYLQESLDDLEDRVLNEPSPEMLQEISQKKRELMNLRRIVTPQREVIAQITRGEVPFIREATRIYFRDVQDNLIHVVETVELCRDLVLGARDIYLSSVSNSLNQVMKTLTIISVVALPLTVVTSFFGMNFQAIPGLGSPTAFWLVVVGMIASMIGLLWLFRYRRWM